MRFRVLVICCSMLLPPARYVAGQQPATPSQAVSSLVDRVGSTGFVQLEADGFKTLSLADKTAAYWLSMAAIAVNPIVYDQNSRYGLREKHLLEEILRHPEGIDAAALKKITDYTKLFWGCHGNYNSQTSVKFLPEFTPAELKTAALQALRNHARLGTRTALLRDLRELDKPIFDPKSEPRLTVKNPPAGEDPLTASANNLYQSVTLADLKRFSEKFPLNSRLIKKNGKLVEQVYRAGTPDRKIPPGLYAAELGRAIRYLREAIPYAEPQQQKAIRDLIRYYQTGAPADWRQFNIDWVQDNPTVDFSNGFVEVYKDARGAKGAMQGFVTMVDPAMNRLMQGFAANAAYFEQHAPWAAQYKQENPHPPLANADDALIETGDFDIGVIGDNLPNESEIHEHYGTKSFIFTGSMRALNLARGDKVAREFCASRKELDRALKYDELQEELYTAMHEVIGHGSGKLSPKLDHEPAYYLKEYYSTLEETRADLVALWNFWDPKLVEMGAIPSYDVSREAYDAEARAALVELHEVTTGDTIEEDHRRGTQLIVNYIRDKTSAIQPIERDGRMYLMVTEYQAMRKGVGMLLAELMRIKAEGDYDAARDLITKYGIRFDTAWRDQVVARYKQLDLPTYWVGINPELVPQFDAQKKIIEVEIRYPRDYVVQQLRYAEIGEEGLHR